MRDTVYSAIYAHSSEISNYSAIYEGSGSDAATENYMPAINPLTFKVVPLLIQKCKELSVIILCCIKERS